VKSFQSLEELKCKLQDDQKIRINVGKELGLPLPLGQRKKYLDFDLLKA